MARLQDANWLETEKGISRARALELARQKLIPHVRLGRQVRFDPDRVQSWLDAGGQALPGGWRQEPEGS